MKNAGLLLILLLVLSSVVSAANGGGASRLDQGDEYCTSATVIAAGSSVNFAESGAMGGTDDCALGIALYSEVWYKFRPDVSGNYLISACNSDNSLSFQVWTNICCSGTVPGTTFRDAASACGGFDPRKSLALVANTDYYIELGYKTASQPSTAYNFQLLGPIATSYSAPGNDLCANAAPLTIDVPIIGTNLGATDDAVPSCGTTSVINGVWYSVVGDGRTLTATTLGIATNINTYLKIFRGTCGGLICAGSNDNITTDTSASSVSWCAEPSVTYYVAVGNVGTTGVGTAGNFNLVVTAGDACSCDALPVCGTPAETEPNNSNPVDCLVFDATQLVCGQIIYARHCPEPDSDFYRVVVPAGQAMTIALYDGATCSTNPPTKVFSRLYTNACAASGGATAANKVINNTAGVTDITQYVLVLDAGTTSPINRVSYKLVATCQGVPANDLCANATLVSVPSSTNGTITYGTVDAVPACPGAPTQPGVWYKLNGNGHSVTVDACVTSFDNKIAVYRGPDCANLVCHGGDDASCGGNGAKYTICTVSGETYWILVYGASVNSGTFTLAVTDNGVCVQNDLCSGAVHVDVPSVTNGTTVGYTTEVPQLTCLYTAISPGTWYTVMGTGHTLTATLTNDVFAGTRFLVFSGSCDNLVCVTGVQVNTLSWCSVAGVEYFILVSGWSSISDFTLTITEGACCSFTDYCANPIVMAHQTTFTNTANSCCATNPIANLGGCSGYSTVSGRDVIYQFTLATNGTVSFTCSGALDNQMMVFSNCANAVGTCIAAADQYGVGITEAITNLNLAQGTYYVSTSAAGTTCGDLTLSAIGDVALPVNLRSSEAIPGDASVRLQWTTASETNNDRFEIVRGGIVVGSLRTQGNGPVGHDYTWSENNLVNGTRYEYVLRAVSLDGAAVNLNTLNAVPSLTAAEVTEYALHQNYPNPFNPTTSVVFDLLEGGYVSLKVYNLMGQEVATLVNGQATAGRHIVAFDAARLPAGIYIYRITANSFSAEKKMLFLK